MNSITSVIIPNGASWLAGRVYRNPALTTSSARVVLVTGSWLTVKEQMAHVYAVALAERGYTAITFDFSGFGESPGEPRQVELPVRKIADLIAVAEYAATIAGPRGVGHLAICASAQYGLAAIARCARIASFVSVAGWFHDPDSIAPYYFNAEGVAERLAWAEAATQAWFKERRLEIAPAYKNGDLRAGMYFELNYYADPQRGAIPNWKNEMSVMSWQAWLTFDGIQSAAHVGAPCLFVHGDGCAMPDNVKRVYGALKGPGELVWADGSQADYYDKPQYVQRAIEAAVRHFAATL